MPKSASDKRSDGWRKAIRKKNLSKSIQGEEKFSSLHQYVKNKIKPKKKEKGYNSDSPSTRREKDRMEVM